MTRLIDADKACKAIENARIEKDTYGSLLNEWDHGYNCGLDRAEDDIQDFIVDAIPVEWLKARYKIEGYYGTDAYFRKAYAVKEIIADWEAEQRKEA